MPSCQDVRSTSSGQSKLVLRNENGVRLGGDQFASQPVNSCPNAVVFYIEGIAELAVSWGQNVIFFYVYTDDS